MGYADLDSDRVFQIPERTFGHMNGHAIGRILKETVRRAMVTIQTERFVFEATAKEGYDGTMDDVFTSADTKAQGIYLRAIQECFPDWGIIAEEESLRIAPKNGSTIWVTVDPLDGTKAYVRRQSHGVGTMIAVVDTATGDTTMGQIISAYVGDINTDEVYGYRPGSSSVFRITKLGRFESLKYHGGDKLSISYVLLRDPPDTYSDASRDLLGSFKNYESSGGSIGIWFARLWKREVAALLIPPGWETPWDSNPIIGISKRLGYAFLKPVSFSEQPGWFEWKEYNPVSMIAKEQRNHDSLVIHHADLSQLGRRLYRPR